MTTSKNVKLEISAQDSASGVIGSIASRFQGLGETANKVLKGVNARSVMTGAGLMKMGKSAFSGMAELYGQYAKLEQSQGEIASLGIDGTGIKTITQTAKEFSNQWASTTAPEFIKASYDIKSGISSLSDEGVAQFTKLAALTGEATKSSVGTMTKLFALGHGIWREDFTSDTQFGKGLSVAISSAVQGFRTEGGDLSQGISAMGKQAKEMGVSMAEQFAIIGNAKGSFSSASEAMTSYRAYLAGLNKAQDKLGLSFTHTSGKLKGQALPMADVLERIKNEFGDFKNLEVQAKIKEAFGSDEAVKIIMGLANNTDQLRESEKNLNQQIRSGNTEKTEAMAKAMQKGKDYELMQQRIGNLGISIGSMFAPAMTLAYNTIGSLAAGISKLIDQFPLLSEYVGWGIAMVSGLAIAYGGLKLATAGVKIAQNLYTLALGTTNNTVKKASVITRAYYWIIEKGKQSFGGVKSAIFGFGQRVKWLAGTMKTGVIKAYYTTVGFGAMVFKKAKTAIWAFGSAIKWAGRMMLTNPIGLAITGIALAAGLIVTFWEPIKAFVSEWIGKIAGFISPVVDWIGEKFAWLIEPIKMVGKFYIGVWKWIGGEALKFFNWIGGKFEWVGSIAKKIGGLFGFGGDDEELGQPKAKIGDVVKKTVATTAVAATLNAPAYAQAPTLPLEVQKTAQVQLQGQNQPKHITQNINIHLSVYGHPNAEELKEKIAHIARLTFEQIREDEQQRRW